MSNYDPELITQLEKETWNRAADSYLSIGTSILTGHAVDRLIDSCNINANMNVLEIGCGPGHIIKMIADRGAVAVGVDLSPEMIRVAKQLHSNIQFEVANAESLPFADDSFDAVLINFTIHHFARPINCFIEILRILKPHGRFVFAGPIEQFGFGAFIQGLNDYHTLEVLAHGPIYIGATQEDYIGLLERAGFKEYDVNTHVIPLKLENLDPLFQVGWEMCQLDDLPAKKQEDIRKAIIQYSHPYKTESGFIFPDRIVIGVAIKS